MKNKRMIFFIHFLLIHLLSTASIADNINNTEQQRIQKNNQLPEPANPLATPLPPGYEINDGKKIIRVWTTQGPVPVAQDPFRRSDEPRIDNPNIIIAPNRNNPRRDRQSD